MSILNIVYLLVTYAIAVNAARVYSCTEKDTIALTFDDGPFEYTSELLDLLHETNITATFFINAENYWKDLQYSESKQAVMRKAYKDGHQIASHTWKHYIPLEEGHEAVKKMMDKMDDFIEEVIGERPNYFRAPGGNCDESCVDFFQEELGYKVIQWDTDTNDWNTSEGVETRVEDVKVFLTKEWSQEKENYLVLMHDVQRHTVKEIVPWILRHAPFEKYRFVSVAECLGHKQDMYKSGHVIDRFAPPEPAINNTIPTNGTEINNNDTIIEDNKFNLVSGASSTFFHNLIFTLILSMVVYLTFTF